LINAAASVTTAGGTWVRKRALADITMRGPHSAISKSAAHVAAAVVSWYSPRLDQLVAPAMDAPWARTSFSYHCPRVRRSHQKSSGVMTTNDIAKMLHHDIGE